MISYDEALQRILEATHPLSAEVLSLPLAYGRALASSLVATENLPGFDNSAVDGYAVGEYDSDSPQKLRLAGEVLAGQVADQPLSPGEVIYVATGAMLPPNTTGIVMMEDVEILPGDTIGFQEIPSAKFIRRAGSDVKKRGNCIARRCRCRSRNRGVAVRARDDANLVS